MTTTKQYVYEVVDTGEEIILSVPPPSDDRSKTYKIVIEDNETGEDLFEQVTAVKYRGEL